jgi:hypothetical protein
VDALDPSFFIKSEPWAVKLTSIRQLCHYEVVQEVMPILEPTKLCDTSRIGQRLDNPFSVFRNAENC